MAGRTKKSVKAKNVTTKYETSSASNFRRALNLFKAKGPEAKAKALRKAGLVKS